MRILVLSFVMLNCSSLFAATRVSFAELVSRSSVPRGRHYISIPEVVRGGVNAFDVLDSHYASLQYSQRKGKVSEKCRTNLAKLPSPLSTISAKRKAIKQDLTGLSQFLAFLQIPDATKTVNSTTDPLLEPLMRRVDAVMPQIISKYAQQILTLRGGKRITTIASNLDEIRVLWDVWRSQYFNNADHFGHISLIGKQHWLEGPNSAFTITDRIESYRSRNLENNRAELLDLMVADFTFFYLVYRA